jgi:integrase
MVHGSGRASGSSKLQGVQKRLSTLKGSSVKIGPRNTTMPRLLTATQNQRQIGGNPRQAVRLSLQARTKDERAEKRQNYMKQSTAVARFQGQTFLEQHAVSREVAIDYMSRMQLFRDFAVSQSLLMDTIQNIDSSFTEFLNDMFAGGSSLGEATKSLAALIDHVPDCGQKGALPRARRCLQGWQRLDPGATRPPIPMELVFLLALKMWEKNLVGHAVILLLMFEGYLRPGEALGLKEEDLVMPTAAHPFHSLNLHPSDRLESSKVGLSDETILLDSSLMPWLGDLLTTRLQGVPNALMFHMTYQDLKNVWMSTLKEIGLPQDHAVLYQLRHSGPSYDRLTKSRSLQDVKKRGRWSADSSVRRYEAHARLAQEFQRLPKKIQQKCYQALKQLPVKVQSFITHRRRRI